MRISDLLYETFSALLANKGRSLLTILGIVIGIASVIAMTSLIGGVKDALVSQLGLEQSRVVFIDFWNGEDKTSSDLEAIAEGVDGYEFVTGLQYGNAHASTDTKQSDTTVLGVAPGYFRSAGSSVKSGRLLSDQELAGDPMEIVVDEYFVRALFKEGDDPVGKKVDLGNDSYTIVGVIENANSFSTQGSVYMPSQTCSIRITGSTDYTQVIGFAREGVDMDALVKETESFVRSHFNIDDENSETATGYLYVQSTESIQRELSSTLVAFQLLMSSVAGISLLVGGIGIMNMMLTNVTERIREIGLRKALGAHNSDITLQFLFESVAICLIGGIIGFALGYGSAYLLAVLSSGTFGQMLLGSDMAITPSISMDTVLLAVGICAGIGIVFGYWPARRAAKLDPVESLRYQ